MAGVGNGRPEHDPETCVAVFPRDKRVAFARRSCSNKELKRDDDSISSRFGVVERHLSDEYIPDDQDDFETAPLRRSKGRVGKVIAAVVVIVAVMGCAGFVWLTYPDIMSFPRAGAAAPTAASDDKPRLEELMSMHEQSVADIESIKQELANEQAALKSIADQLTALTGRLAAVESAAPPPASPEPVAPAPKPKAAAKPKAASSPRASGPVSVGGAPLAGPRPQ
jgi:uncharacterized coiled-coil protein SlyX